MCDFTINICSDIVVETHCVAKFVVLTINVRSYGEWQNHILFYITILASTSSQSPRLAYLTEFSQRISREAPDCAQSHFWQNRLCDNIRFCLMSVRASQMFVFTLLLTALQYLIQIERHFSVNFLHSKNKRNELHIHIYWMARKISDWKDGERKRGDELFDIFWEKEKLMDLI